MYDHFNCATYGGQAGASSGQEWQKGERRGSLTKHLAKNVNGYKQRGEVHIYRVVLLCLQYYSLTTFCTIERNHPVSQI